MRPESPRKSSGLILRERSYSNGSAADAVVAVVVCRPCGRVGVVGLRTGARRCRDVEPVDRAAFSAGLARCRCTTPAAIVIAISRNVDDTAARLVGCPIELDHRE